MGDLTFMFLALFIVVTGVWVVTARNLVHAAVALMGTLFGVAGLYVFLYADFVAATQVLVYVGGILVLIIFGVMLTQKIRSIYIIQEPMGNRALAGIVVLLVFMGLSALLFRTPWHEGPMGEVNATVDTIGHALLTRYLLHFEVASVLLLVALLGAAYLSRRENG